MRCLRVTAKRMLQQFEAILFRLEQRGLGRADLEPYIGSSGRVSEVLGRKRGLSLAMIRKLHKGLNIPYETLIST